MKFFIQFFISGIFTSLIFPPFFITPIGFFIFPYIFFLINHKKYRSLGYFSHFISGFFYGLGFLIIFLDWIKEPFLLDISTKKLFLFSYLLVFYCSIFFGLCFAALKYFKNPILKLIILPILFVIVEFSISNIGYGFPWISFSLASSGNFLGFYTIYYLGTYGLSYLTLFTFIFPAIFLFKKSKYIKILFFAYIFVFIVLFLLLANRNIFSYLEKNSEKLLLKISVAQINFPINQKIDSQVMQLKYDYIIKTITNDNSDIIIFGENNFPFLLDGLDQIKLIQEILKKDQSVIIGTTSKDDDKFYNSMLIFDKNNVQRFDKKILVPFGEFIPFRNFFRFMDFIVGSSDYSTGDNKRFLSYKNINILPVICYEIIYFWQLLSSENINTNIIVNITNDSWFGNFSGPYQHFYFTKLRAAEFNKPLIRVSNNGISAIINNFGQVVDYIPLDTKKKKVIKLNIPNYNKNYIKLHQYIIYFIFIFLFIGILLNKKK